MSPLIDREPEDRHSSLHLLVIVSVGCNLTPQSWHPCCVSSLTQWSTIPLPGLVPTPQLYTRPRSSPTNSVRWSRDTARLVTAAGSVLSAREKAVCIVSCARYTSCNSLDSY